MKTAQIIFIVFVVGIVMIAASYFVSLKNSSVQTTQKDNLVVSSPTPATVGLLSYSDAKENFTLQYPANWRPKEFDGGVGFYLNDPGFSMENAQPIVIRFVEKTPNDAQLSLEAYAKVAAGHEIQNYRGLASFNQFTTDSGLIGYQTTWKVMPLGANATLTESLPITYFATSDNKTKVIQVTLENAAFADVYQNVLKSISVMAH